MPLKDYLDVGKEAAQTALTFPFGPQTALNAVPGQDWEGAANIAGNVGMGALELGNVPFEAIGETVRGASENEPFKMASAQDQSGFRWPSIVQRLAPSTRTDEPPADPFMKAYQGLEGLVNLPGRGLQGASDIVTGQPDIAAQLGGLGLGLGVTPWNPQKMAAPEMPRGLINERGGLTLGPGAEPPAASPAQAASPWFSRLESTLQEKLPPKADVGQVKNIMATLPKEEAQVRGLDEFLSKKFGQVPKAEIMQHLEQNPVTLGEKKLAGTASDYRKLSRVEDDLPNEVLAKADELQQEAADRAMEDFYWEPPEGFGLEEIDMTNANLEHGAGQVDLWGKEIEPLPQRYIVKYNGDPILHEDLPDYYAKKATPNEEGHAVFSDESDAINFFDEYTDEDRTRAQDEAYQDWINDNPSENFIEDAKSELDYVPEDVEELETLPGAPGAGPAKFESYSTPGGENYREVLMTTPTSMQEYNTFADSLRAKYGQGGFDNLPLTDVERTRLTQLQDRGETSPFTGGHWDEPNVLAHLRLKDFSDPATGKKTLLVDEIQSDWHQKGRQSGYKMPEAERQAKIAALKKQMDDLEAQSTLDPALAKDPEFNKRYTDTWQQYEDANRTSGQVPNAPFKKNWHELAFKRALREAVEGDYDEMAWTTGEQQADRYNLAKQVESIEYKKDPSSDIYSIFATDHNGRRVEIGDHPAARLSDVVGKELADKLVAGEGASRIPLSDMEVAGHHGFGPSTWELFTDKQKQDYRHMAQKAMEPKGGSGYKSLSGVDLKVGGEGMKGFYDEILPSYANKYLKKYGVKVEGGPLEAQKPFKGRLRYSVTLGPGQDWDAFPTRELAEEAAANMGKGYHVVDLATETPPGETVHKIPITPEMKADILGKGQPMWQVPAMIGAGAAGAAAGGAPDQQQYAHGGIVEEEQDMPNNRNPNGSAGYWKDDLAGYMDKHFGGRPGKRQHMARGGFAQDSEEPTYGPPAPPPLAAPALAFDPKAGLPPTPPDPLQAYLAQQKESLNRYGPEEQLAQERQMQSERGGFVPRLASAGAGLADAIMQGVARAGPSNFQANLANRWDKSQEGQRSALQHAQTGHLAKMKQEMELSNMDPASPISRLTQRSKSPMLKQLGLTDEEIQNLPASLIGDIETKGLTLEEIQSRAELAKAVQENTASYQQGMLGLSREKQTYEETEKEKDRQVQSAKGILARDVAPKIKLLGSEIPIWPSPISRKQRRQAREVVEGRLSGTPSAPGGAAPKQVNTRQEWMALPSGTPYTDSHGKRGVKK